MHNVNTIAIAGVPNCGKTSLFNALTGARQKVGNWPGVTVERIQGAIALNDVVVELIDLPGTYNLTPDTEDQRVAERVIREGEFDLILNVVDATSLSRNLFLTLDLKEHTDRIIVLLNMVDVAENEGIAVDPEALSQQLGLPVVPLIAVNKDSVKAAVRQIEALITAPKPAQGYAERQEVLDTVRKYARIDEIYQAVTQTGLKGSRGLTHKIDAVVLNRFAAIPVFLASMFVMFWFAIGLGSVFIDFFDILAGMLFVDLPQQYLSALGASEWLTDGIIGGLGAGIQTVATFIPVVFFMFLSLAILEDLGYMARIAVIADRFMRMIGLPGSAFVPMVVGFGCTVPAIMSTRTLGSTRDRFMTIFMAPFMSCGARLPVYALFCVALFGSNSGLAVFLIYLSGLALAIFTGFLLKNTLFRGTPSSFVVDLPMYHIPRLGTVLKSAWIRMMHFVKRAGAVVVTAVFILSLFNSIGMRDGQVTFGNEDSQSSALSYVGKTIAPVFEPMGIKHDNWQASVALFTGLFAKEAIVGTINSLYASSDAGPSAAEADDTGDIDVQGTVAEAFASVGENLIGVISSVDLLGVGLVTEDANAVSEEIGADVDVYRHLAANFTVYSAFAYLLFVLVYFPCLAALGAAKQEMGGGFAAVMAAYSTLLAWAVATLFYQITEGHNLIYIAMACGVFVLLYLGLRYLGVRALRSSTATPGAEI